MNQEATAHEHYLLKMGVESKSYTEFTYLCQVRGVACLTAAHAQYQVQSPNGSESLQSSLALPQRSACHTAVRGTDRKVEIPHNDCVNFAKVHHAFTDRASYYGEVHRYEAERPERTLIPECSAVMLCSDVRIVRTEYVVGQPKPGPWL